MKEFDGSVLDKETFSDWLEEDGINREFAGMIWDHRPLDVMLWNDEETRKVVKQRNSEYAGSPDESFDKRKLLGSDSEISIKGGE